MGIRKGIKGLTASGNPMTIAEKANAIFKHILDKCNNKEIVSFSQDCLGNSLTITIEDEKYIYHNHAWGDNYAEMINDMYNIFDGSGLNWIKDDKDRES